MLRARPVRRLVGLAIGFVERLDLQRIGAADRRGHGFGGGAQHVHVRVVNGFGPVRGARVDRHFAGIGTGGAEARYRAGPHRAGGPQLGDFQEVAGPDGERKHQRLCGIVRRETAIRELGNDLDSFGERESEFLDYGCAGFGESVGSDGDGAKLRCAGRADQAGGAIEICQGFVIDAVGQALGLRRPPRPPRQRLQQFGGAIAGFEVNGAWGERIQNFVDTLVAQHEANLVRAGIQRRLRRRCVVNHRPDPPCIVAPRAAGIGKLAWPGIRILQAAQIFGAIVKPCFGSCAFQILADDLIPLFGRDGRELF